MTQALYAHMNNKTIKTKQNKKNQMWWCLEVGPAGEGVSVIEGWDSHEFLYKKKKRHGISFSFILHAHVSRQGHVKIQWEDSSLYTRKSSLTKNGL
jgi:hypothetical protein